MNCILIVVIILLVIAFIFKEAMADLWNFITGNWEF